LSWRCWYRSTCGILDNARLSPGTQGAARDRPPQTLRRWHKATGFSSPASTFRAPENTVTPANFGLAFTPYAIARRRHARSLDTCRSRIRAGGVLFHGHGGCKCSLSDERQTHSRENPRAISLAALNVAFAARGYSESLTTIGVTGEETWPRPWIRPARNGRENKTAYPVRSVDGGGGHPARGRPRARPPDRRRVGAPCRPLLRTVEHRLN